MDINLLFAGKYCHSVEEFLGRVKQGSNIGPNREYATTLATTHAIIKIITIIIIIVFLLLEL